MTEFLFAGNKNWGHDIVTLNVQRGRDHQIQGYTFYKNMCGFGETISWDDLTDLITDEHVHTLTHTYAKPDDVDMYVAGAMEIPKTGSVVGPTFHCLIQHQFKNLKIGDRFFFTNPGQFSESQLSEIKKQSMASVFCENSDNSEKLKLTKNVFEKIDENTNPLMDCNEFPRLDFKMWL